MALRTVNLRAHLEGEGERRREWGECLVMTSQYMLCSETCLPWQGRVYTDDVYAGADEEDIRHYTAKGYKRLSTAIKGGLFHPNCRHTLSTWFEGISTMPVPHNESEVRENRELAEKESHCKRQIQKYKRLKAGSCDKSNAAKYGKKVNQWQEKLKEVRAAKASSAVGKAKLLASPKGLSAKIGGRGIPKHDEPVFVKKIDINDKKLIERELKSFEDYAINEDIEMAYVITKDGEVYRCFGVEYGVYPDADLGDKLYGAIVSHNHPIDETEYSFSNADIDLFIDYGLEKLRGIDEKYIYELTRNADDIDSVDDSIYTMTEEKFRHSQVVKKAKAYKIGYRRWNNDGKRGKKGNR